MAACLSVLPKFLIIMTRHLYHHGYQPQRQYDEGEEGFDIENHYGALLELSRDLGVSVRAGFVPRDVARIAPKNRDKFLAICQKEGWGDESVYQDLGGPEEYFRMFRAMITGEVCSSHFRIG